MELIEKEFFFSENSCFLPNKVTLTPRSSGTGAHIKNPKTLLLGDRGGISIPSKKANPVTSLKSANLAPRSENF